MSIAVVHKLWGLRDSSSELYLWMGPFLPLDSTLWADLVLHFWLLHVWLLHGRGISHRILAPEKVAGRTIED